MEKAAGRARDADVAARVREILGSATERIAVRDVIEQAVRDVCGRNVDALVALAALCFAPLARTLRRESQRIPDPPADGWRAAPVDIPPGGMIVPTVDGDVYVPRDKVTVGDVRAWSRDALGCRWDEESRGQADAQRARHERAAVDLACGENLPAETPWRKAREAIDLSCQETGRIR